MRHALCQVLKHGDAPRTVYPPVPDTIYIEGLGLHVVYITRYVMRIKKHLYNRIEKIEIERH